LNFSELMKCCIILKRIDKLEKMKLLIRYLFIKQKNNANDEGAKKRATRKLVTHKRCVAYDT